MCSRCVLTVSGEMKSCSAMSLFVWPNASSCRTSTSRAVRVSALRSRSFGVGQLLGQGDHQLGVDHHVAAGDQANRLDQVLGVARLQHVAAGPGADGFDHELAVVVGGQHDHADVGVLLRGCGGRPPGRPSPASGCRAARCRARPSPFSISCRTSKPFDGLAHDVDVAGHLEVPAKALTDQGVVVRDDDLDRHTYVPSAGGPRICRPRGQNSRPVGGSGEISPADRSWRARRRAEGLEDVVPVHEQQEQDPEEQRGGRPRTARGGGGDPRSSRPTAQNTGNRGSSEPGERHQRPAGEDQQRGAAAGSPTRRRRTSGGTGPGA